MRLYEYEAKELFSKNGIRVPAGKVARDPEEARKVAEEIGKPVVVKAQVLVGGRGKAGGIKFAGSPEEVKRVAEEILSLEIKGLKVKSLLVEEKLDVKEEFYVGVIVDRIEHRPLVMVSRRGGVDIEKVAEEEPEEIQKLHLDITETMMPYQARSLARDMGLSGGMMTSVAGVIQKIYSLFKKLDAKTVEINPLILTEDGLVAGDAKMILDDDSLFRHPDLKEMGIAVRHEVAELTPREREAREAGIPYLDLDGYIGMFPGGAGFGIASIDLIKMLGGEPANFMDSGGGPTPERIAKMLDILVDNPNVVAIFGARFGGISRCDDFAKGLVMFLEKKRTKKPMAIRMTGNKWKEGMEILAEAKRENPELFQKIEVYGIETPIEEVAKRAIELAKTERGGG